MFDFVLRVIEVSIKVNYSNQVCNLLSDIMFSFLTIFGAEKIFPRLADHLQTEMKLTNKREEMEQLAHGFDELQQNVQFRLELFQRDRFHDKFKLFVQLLCKLGDEQKRVIDN